MSSVIEPGFVVDGRYAVERELGRGAFGVVYRVRHLKLDTAYALKVLSVPSAAVRRRMLQEGRVQASLRHPNIVSVTDVVEVDGCPGLVMEFVEGDTLEALLRRRTLSWDQVDELAEGVIAGVAEAHRRGFVHRDLKPANVLLATVGGDLVPKIADFGLAKIMSDEGGVTHTRSGVMMGTPAYMAPEQSKNAKAVDRRADVFALGAILYELACGRRAFDGDDIVDVLTAVRREAYVPPREIRPDVPARIARAIEGALRADPERRFPDCGALLAAFQGREASKKGLWADLAPGPTLAPANASGLKEQEPDETWRGGGGSGASAAPMTGTATVPIPATVHLDAALPEGSLAPQPAVPSRVPEAGSSTSGAGVARYALAGTALAGLAGVAALVVVVAGGLAVFGGAPWDEVAADPVSETPEPEPATVDAVAPAVEPPVQPEPVAPAAEEAPQPPASVPPPASRAQGSSSGRKPASKASGAAAGAAPAEPVVEVAPKQAQVIVTGVDRVLLVSEAGSYSPGPVPPGTYEVQVFFDPARATPAVTLTVGPGEVRTLRCAPDLKVCR
jgi:hypothetical protein